METKENLEMAQDSTAAALNAESVEQGNDTAKDVGTHQEHIKEALELLYVNFPQAFIKEGDCKPLKIGILEDLKTRIAGIEGLSISKVRAAVRVYTTRLRYFYSVREGAKRVDLDGNEVDSVTAEHAEYARSRFTEINAKRQGSKPKRAPHAPRRQGSTQGGNQSNGQRQERRGNSGHNGQNRRFSQSGSNFNRNRSFKDAKRFEPAKESDLKAGRYVYVSLERNNFTQGTVSSVMRDEAKVTLRNGLSVTIPVSSIYVQHGRGPADGRNNRPRGHMGNRGGDRSRQRHDSQKGAAPSAAGTSSTQA